MPLHQLTERAQTQYHNMKDEVEEAFNRVSASQHRIHETEAQIRNKGDAQAGEIMSYNNELTRQQQRRDVVQLEYQQLARVFTTIRTWVDMIPRNMIFEDARKCDPDIRSTEDHLEAVTRIRIEIEDTVSLRNAARNSMPPISEQYEHIDEFVRKLAEQGKPGYWLDGNGEPVIKLPTNVTSAFMAWCNPDEMRDGLYTLADNLREKRLREGCEEVESREAKADAIALYKKSILSLERQEETLIREAAMMGTTIPRREQASPLAILGLKTKGNKPKMTKTLAEGTHAA